MGPRKVTESIYLNNPKITAKIIYNAECIFFDEASHELKAIHKITLQSPITYKL